MAGAIKQTMNKVADTVGGAVGQTSASMATSADAFVQNVAIGDLYEITAARLALKRTQSETIRAFATRMIDDHVTNTHHLQAALEMNETRSVSPAPRELDARRHSMLKHLEEASDEAFDRTYIDQQLMAHEETSTLMHTFGDSGDNPQLRSLAWGAIPVIDRHLQQVKALRAQL